MTGVSYLDMWRLVLPEAIVGIAAFCVLSIDLMFLSKSETRLRNSIGTVVSLVGCAGAVAWILHTPQSANILDGMLVVNPVAERMQIALLVLTMLAILTFIGSTFTRH